MSFAQADHFASTYSVVTQFTDPVTGLSATVFENTATHSKHLAIRGTNDGLDVLTDYLDIMLLGTAEYQYQYATLKSVVQQWLDDDKLSGGFTISGHSLGGFLASTLTVDFAGLVSHTYLYNTPGLGGIVGSPLIALWNALNPGQAIPLPDSLPISNILAEAGLSIVSGLGTPVAPQIPISIEDQSPNLLANHSIVTLTDALVIYDLFARVDPSVSVDTITSILKAAANRTVNTLESAFAELGWVYRQVYSSGEATDRNAFYANLYELQGVIGSNHGTVVSLIGQSREQIASLAKTNIAYRYALEWLDPFVVTGNPGLYTNHNVDGHLDADQFSDLYLQDRAAMLTWKIQFDSGVKDADDLLPGDKSYDAEWDTGSISGDWKFTDVLRDITLTINGNGVAVHHIAFGDYRDNTFTGGEVSDHLYGGGGNDILTGNGGDDHLEGGQGNDALNGGLGADHLAGGAGHDTYYAGRNDTIIDSDHSGAVDYEGRNLAAMEFEFLYGDGTNEYYKEMASGAVITYDPAGQYFKLLDSIGVLNIENFNNGDFGVRLLNTEPESPVFARTVTGTSGNDYTGAYVFQNIGRYYFSGAISGSQPGVALYPGEFYLTDATPPNLQIDGGMGNDQLIGLAGSDYISGGSGDDLMNGEFEWTSDDPITYARLNPWGDMGQADVLLGEAGKDVILAGYGDDVVSGGEDNDFLAGGEGNDTVGGDDGNDVGTGSVGNDLLFGGIGDDILYGDGYLNLGWIGPADIASLNFRMSFDTKGYPISVNLEHFYVLDDAPEPGDDIISGGNGNDLLKGNGGNDILLGEEDHDTLQGDSGDDYLDGGDGNDWLIGDDGRDATTGNDTLYGGMGDDELHGNGGDDLLSGEDGNDILGGGAGNDTYVFGQGCGQDTVYDTNGAADIIRLADALPDNLMVARDQGNLYLALSDTGDRLAVANWFSGSAYRIEQVEFADGMVWDAAMLESAIATASATNGNDELCGGDGDDLLDGMGGNDTLIGGAGNDIYIFGQGGGQDTVYDTDGVADIIRLADVLPGDIRVTRDRYNLYLAAGDTGDRLAVKNWFRGAEYRIEGVAFADGTTWDTATLENAITTASTTSGDDELYGNGGDDHLYGGDGNDLLDGLEGNDTLAGGAGNDTYVFGQGGGQDRISDTSGAADIIRFADVSPLGIRVTRGQHNLYLTIKDTDDRLIVENWFRGTGNKIEQVEFADGTTWNTATLESAITIAPGTSGDDELYGGSGRDYLYGYAGNDTLAGGAGRDYLFGGAGSDLYLFERGDGWDIISDPGWREYTDPALFENDVDTIRFGEDIVSSDLRLSWDGSTWDGYSLRLVIDDSGEEVKIEQAFFSYVAGSSYKTAFDRAGGIERLEFGDGGVWTVTDLLARLMDGTAGADWLYGTDAGDTITGNGGDDRFEGFDGNDAMDGGAGNDNVVGGIGSDTLIGGAGDDVLYGNWQGRFGEGEDDNILIGRDGNDVLYGDWGDDIMSGGAGNDTLYGGEGNDIYLFDVELFDVDGPVPSRSFLSEPRTICPPDLGRVVGQDIIYNRNSVDGGRVDWQNQDIIRIGMGIAPVDIVVSRDGGNLLLAVSGTEDRLAIGGWFTSVNSAFYRGEQLEFSDGTIWNVSDLAKMVAGTGGPVLVGAEGDDILVSSEYWQDDVLAGNGGDDRLKGEVGCDWLDGGEGDDLLLGDTEPEFYNVDALSWWDGVMDDRLDGGFGSDTLYGGAGRDVLLGGDGDDRLFGDTTPGGDPVGWGNNMDDILNGEAGNDILCGGEGNDTYIFNFGDGIDTINDYETADMDHLSFGPGITPSDFTGFTKVDNDLIVKVGTNGDQLTIVNWFGGRAGQLDVAFADGMTLTAPELMAWTSYYSPHGSSSIDYLYGGSGDDVLEGGEGNDYLYGYDGTNQLIGGSGDDILDGGWGADLLDGGTGNDTLNGGDNDDIYVFARGYGQDIVYSWDQYGNSNNIVRFLPDVAPSETLARRTGDENNDLVLSIRGTHDILTITGFFNPDHGQNMRIDAVEFADGTVWDAEYLTTLASAAIPGDLVLTGTAGDDALTGTTGNDTLQGGAGNDLLSGGDGNDTYLFNPGDGVDQLVDSGGADTVQFGAGITADSLSLGLGSLLVWIGDQGDAIHLEDFNPDDPLNSSVIEQFQFADGTVLDIAGLLQRGFDIRGSDGGDSLAGTAITDRITGGEGADTLAGGKGSDLLAGGGGDDTYVFHPGDGEDTIEDVSSAAEGNLIAFGMGIAASDLVFERDGGDLMIRVGSQGDALRLKDFDRFGNNGSLVADRLQFADGSQASLFQLTNTAPVVAGAPQNQAAVEEVAYSFTIPTDTFADVDAGDILVYSAILGNGNSLPAWLAFDPVTRTFSGTPANGDVGVLDVAVIATDTAGAAAVAGFTLEIANVNDAPTVAARLFAQSAQEDVAFGFTIPAEAFTDVDAEDLLTYTASLADGSALPSWLSFDAATRTFSGTPASTSAGLWNVRVTATDKDGASAGDDFVLDIANHIVGTATANRLIGTVLRDVIEGLAGKDTLNGGDGADTMIGGAGNDTYHVDDAGDTVVEAANKGTDQVISSVSYVLAENVEDLTLTGTEEINGTGNDLDNVIVGNAAANILDGRAGNDTLSGGAGNDTYRFSLGDGADVINHKKTAGFDTLAFGPGIGQAGVALFRNGHDLEIGYSSIDKVSVSKFFSRADYRVDELKLSDGSHLTATEINGIIQAMTAYAVHERIEVNSLDDVYQNDALMGIIAGSWNV